MDPKHVERLALIKYMVVRADSDSQQPEPTNSLALLTFHDAVELFLGLAVDALSATLGKRAEFADYFAAIEDKLLGKTLGHVEAMKRLNKARVGLKHSGILPGRDTVQKARMDTARFLSDATALVFGGLSFDSVSLVDFIQCQVAKNHLVEAKRLHTTGDPDDRHRALIAITVAYSELLEDYESRKRDGYTSVLAPDIDVPSYYINKLEGPAQIALATLGEAANVLANAIVLLRLGIDGRKHARFDALTPSQVDVEGGTYICRGPPRMEQTDGFEFCLTFVVELALQLQTLDFDITKSPVDAPSWHSVMR